jgi:ATP-binding cassette subfamily F protein 3
MRIELSKLLFQANDVLLLDEPTNHLDIESNLVRKFLRNYPVVVIVSHDKMFLITLRIELLRFLEGL